MKTVRHILVKSLLGCLLCCSLPLGAYAQADRSEVRSGNRAYAKGEFASAELEYRRALERDSNSVAAHYNLGSALYKQEKYDGAEESYASRLDSIANPVHKADAFHNLGNAQLLQKKYAESIASYKDALRLRPDDMETKTNLAYAQKMLKNEQDQQEQQQDQNQDQDQDQDQDQQQNQDQQNQDQNQDQKQQQQPPPKISPQDAQQMLEAMQNKEKETQEKVNKEKAKAAPPVRSGKNW